MPTTFQATKLGANYGAKAPNDDTTTTTTTTTAISHSRSSRGSCFFVLAQCVFSPFCCALTLVKTKDGAVSVE